MSSPLQTNIMLSGGARGADQAWAQAATQAGHKVKVFAVEKKDVHRPYDELTLIGGLALACAMDRVDRANQTLKRNLEKRTEYSMALIARNNYQIENATTVYAVGWLDKETKAIEGDIAWACQMFLDKNLYPVDNCFGVPEPKGTRLYFFGQHDQCWFQYMQYDHLKYRWQLMGRSGPPTPSGIWAGIGSRDLTEGGLRAIMDLLSPKV